MFLVKYYDPLEGSEQKFTVSGFPEGTKFKPYSEHAPIFQNKLVRKLNRKGEKHTHFMSRRARKTEERVPGSQFAERGNTRGILSQLATSKG